MSDIRTTIVLGDMHFPFEDVQAVLLAYNIVREVQPGRVVQVGDLVDGYALSRFPKDPERVAPTLKQETDRARYFVEAITAECREAWWCGGNHDVRLDRYIAERAPMLAETHPSLHALLGIDEKRYVPYQKALTFGKVSYLHDLGRSGVNAARETLAAFGGSVCFGHTHRAGIVYDGDTQGTRRFALNVGWLGNPDEARYLHEAGKKGWMHGIGVVRQDRRGLAWANFVPFLLNERGDLTAVLDDHVFTQKAPRKR